MCDHIASRAKHDLFEFRGERATEDCIELLPQQTLRGARHGDGIGGMSEAGRLVVMRQPRWPVHGHASAARLPRLCDHLPRDGFRHSSTLGVPQVGSGAGHQVWLPFPRWLEALRIDS